MTYDDETLMAFADGELDDAQRSQIEAAMARDPELARRVSRHRDLRTRVDTAFAPVLTQPVPARLEEVARGTAADARARGNVVRFPARTSRAPATPWRSREWLAMAASLLAGVFLSWRFVSPASAPMVAREGALVAQGALAAALESQLAGEQSGTSAVLIGVTFAANDGGYCRTFILRDTATAGLACRERGEWRVPATNAVELPAGELRQASSMPPAILQAIDARLAGEPLDAAAEKAARDADWSRP
jgi:hypothetical protein